MATLIFCNDETDVSSLKPESSVAAPAPPDGFFDPNAAYIGAFEDGDDNWNEGSWFDWNDN